MIQDAVVTQKQNKTHYSDLRDEDLTKCEGFIF